MQGNLQEFNIRSILQLIELEQYTGTLYIEYETFLYPKNSKSALIPLTTESIDWSLENSYNNCIWLLYFVNGKITYATDSNYDKFLRIYDYLSYFQLEKYCSFLQEKSVNITSPKEYSCIWLLIQQKLILPNQALIIIKSLIKETLLELSNLTQGKFFFQIDNPLTPQWRGLKTSVLVREIGGQLQLWKQFSPYIQSPHQQLILSDENQLSKNVSAKNYKTLSIWAEKKLSLLRLSRQLNYSVVYVAKALYPLVKKGWIKLVDNDEQIPQNAILARKISKPHIVCIDDEVTIGKNVEYILKQRGYDSTIITNPIEALTTILQVKPDLIICDLDMPQLNGYELCNMLQNSRAIRPIPIIIISEQDNCLTRLRARIVSSTNYLSKPFTKNELIILVERCLSLARMDNFSSFGQSLPVENVSYH